MMLIQQMKEDMKQAMRDKNQVALTAIRGVLSAFTNEAITLGKGPDGVLSDDEALAVIRREVKRRKDAIEQFTAGGRADLADDDRAELAVLEPYLPAMMSRDAIRDIVRAKMADMGDIDKSKSGQLVGMIMKDLAGQADGTDVKAVVEELLG